MFYTLPRHKYSSQKSVLEILFVISRVKYARQNIGLVDVEEKKPNPLQGRKGCCGKLQEHTFDVRGCDLDGHWIVTPDHDPG
jgi:hypothetical protein